jgi:RNA polymerase sigma-70 factor (ECF subfamily)
MALAPNSGSVPSALSAAVRGFVAQRYESSGASQYGMDQAGLQELLVRVATQAASSGASEGRTFLDSLHLEELVLARACVAGNERAWEVFLNRYRATLYETAHKIAGDYAAARGLADSLYAELYGVSEKGEQRTSKLSYYQGRGSLQGWLRVVVAQEFVNRYRSTKRETSLDAALDDGAQFAATQPETATSDPRVENAVATELRTLRPEERFLLASYFLDRRTLAEIAKLLRVHESTVSRKLERVTKDVRKRIRKRLVESGMPSRQADEFMEDVDVRDLQVSVRETLQQDSTAAAFYKGKGESQG